MTAAEATRLATEAVTRATTNKASLQWLVNELTKIILKDEKKETVTQAEAWRRFGRGTVERWRSQLRIIPKRVGERKLIYDYRKLKELEAQGL